jgi:hypothetical protein
MESKTHKVCDTEQEVIEQFHQLEKDCIAFDNGVNNEDRYYLKTLDQLR